MISKRLVVQPKGKIKGGFLSVAADVQKGVLNYLGEITVGVLFITKTVPFKGVYTVDPNILLSNACTTGKKLVFGPVTIIVCDPVGQHQMLAAVNHTAYPGVRGQAVIGVRDKYIDIQSISVQGQAFGTDIDLFAR